MPKEPEQMLEKNWVSATCWVKERSIEVTIGKQIIVRTPTKLQCNFINERYSTRSELVSQHSAFHYGFFEQFGKSFILSPSY